MMTGGDANLKSLVLLCLEDDPELRPSAIDISERTKRMVEECRKETTYDGMDPISWLAEQASDARHIIQQSKFTTPNLFAGPVTIKWKEGPPAPSSRMIHSAVMFNGSIYVGGGITEKEQATYCVDIYHSDTNKWDTIDTPHHLFCLVVLLSKLLIVGGSDRNGRYTKKVLALESGEWIDYTEMPSARSYVGAVSHHSMMIVVGGYRDEALAVVELFDGSTGEWFICDDLPRPLEYPQAVVLGNMIYVLDKLENIINASSLHSLFDHNLQWHCLTDMPHNSSSAVVLNNKYLLVLGGLLLNNGRSSDEIVTLNSISTEWISSAKIPEALSYTAVVCDDSHRLVVIGGCEEGRLVGTSRVWLGSFEL
ncbi:influenza virus NS1A-binding protein homolog isoform X2 [Dysidea avara]|uniref:influenza virus NS1A-binding protein homolog isoform X2 n=1 Tax=Dysidea avara TaxID=196820 RepID=UPI003316F5E5